MLAVVTPGVAAGIALALRDVERRAGVYMLGLVLAATLSVTPQIIGFSGFYGKWPNLTFAPFSGELYLPALFHAHAAQLIRGRVERLWLWLLPGAFVSLYYTVAFLGFDSVEAKWAYNDAFHEPYVFPLELVVTLGLVAVAVVRSARLLAEYQRYLDATESVDALFDPGWIRWSVRIVTVTTVLWGGLNLTSLFTNVSYVGGYPVHVAVMALISALALATLSGLREPFPKLGEVALDEPEPETDADVPASGPSEDWASLGNDVRTRIETEHWYQEPRLSIRDVARRMGTNETYVSRGLNDGLSVTFKDCVNALRVADAQRRLRETDDPVLSVGLAAGFASKSTFNRVFRAQAGLTPTAYRTSQNPEIESQTVN